MSSLDCYNVEIYTTENYSKYSGELSKESPEDFYIIIYTRIDGTSRKSSSFLPEREATELESLPRVFSFDNSQTLFINQYASPKPFYTTKIRVCSSEKMMLSCAVDTKTIATEMMDKFLHVPKLDVYMVDNENNCYHITELYDNLKLSSYNEFRMIVKYIPGNIKRVIDLVELTNSELFKNSDKFEHTGLKGNLNLDLPEFDSKIGDKLEKGFGRINCGYIAYGTQSGTAIDNNFNNIHKYLINIGSKHITYHQCDDEYWNQKKDIRKDVIVVAPVKATADGLVMIQALKETLEAKNKEIDDLNKRLKASRTASMKLTVDVNDLQIKLNFKTEQCSALEELNKANAERLEKQSMAIKKLTSV